MISERTHTYVCMFRRPETVVRDKLSVKFVKHFNTKMFGLHLKRSLSRLMYLASDYSNDVTINQIRESFVLLSRKLEDYSGVLMGFTLWSMTA